MKNRITRLVIPLATLALTTGLIGFAQAAPPVTDPTGTCTLTVNELAPGPIPGTNQTSFKVDCKRTQSASLEVTAKAGTQVVFHSLSEATVVANSALNQVIDVAAASVCVSFDPDGSGPQTPISQCV